MAVDTGKHAYLDKTEYFCAPRTEKAEEMLYSRANTVTVLKFYLRHPDKSVIMLDAVAKAGAEQIPDFVIYVGQKTTQEHETVNKFGLWQDLRTHIVANRFWELFAIYSLVLFMSICLLMNKKSTIKDKLLIGLYLTIAGIGIIQFPLTVIGNGFADNTEQWYIFRLTFDITVIIGIYLLIPLAQTKIDALTMALTRHKKTSKKIRKLQ